MKAIYFIASIIVCTMVLSIASCKKDTTVSYNDSDLHYVQRYESKKVKLSDTAMAISNRYFKNNRIDDSNFIVYAFQFSDGGCRSSTIYSYETYKGLRVYPYNYFFSFDGYTDTYLSSAFWDDPTPADLNVNDIKLDTTAKLKAFGAVKLFADKVNNDKSSIETKRTILFDTIIVKFGYYAILKAEGSISYTKCWMVKTEGDVFALAFINDALGEFLKFEVFGRKPEVYQKTIDSY